jgi:hypothetical protein
MNQIAAGLGSMMCNTGVSFGLPGARCFDLATQQGLGYAGAALLLLLLVAALRGLGRWA